MRILGVEVIPFLISAGIMTVVATAFSNLVGQEPLFGLKCGLIASTISFFIIVFTEQR